MSKKVRFRGQLLFLFVERRPSSSGTIIDLGGLLLLECNLLTKIFGTCFFCQFLHFDVVHLIFFSTVRALAAKNFRFPWMHLESNLFCAMFEVAQHFLKLLLCGSKQEHVVSKAQISEAVVIVRSFSLKQLPNLFFFCHRGRSSFKATCRTVLKSKLDNGSPCLVPLLDFEHVAVLVRHYSSFLVVEKSCQEVDVLMLDTTGFEGVPN